jgi:O-antigen/teichoic acid export membrane protein
MVLVPAARSAIDLKFKVHMRQAKLVVLAALPFYVNTWAINLAGKLDVAILEFITNDQRELGWFGATVNLASLAMLLSPLMFWVLIPLLARARKRSEEEVYAILRRSIEGLMVAIIPVTLLISLGAPLWIRVAFGGKFDQAAPSLAIYALDFILIYLAMLFSILLMTVDRPWNVTMISASAIPIRAMLMLTLVKPFSRWLGPGGAAVGASVSEVTTMVWVVSASFYSVGRRAVDRRGVLAIGKSLAAAAVVIAIDRLFLRPLGHVRLVVDMALYAAIVLGTGAVKISEVIAAVKMVLAGRKARKDAAVTATAHPDAPSGQDG